MGFIDVIREAARQLALGPGVDDWYYKSMPYVLELNTSLNPLTGVVLGQAYMVLPLGPENYTVDRVFRQSVTPTMGGVVAEERGLLWRNLTITGTFGLEPKRALDTSISPELPNPIITAGVGALAVAGLGLSGPGWTRRMILNFFEKYANLKANQQFASDTKLIWHDLKTDDHWVVVPESIEIARTPTRRFQYPYTMRFKAIANAGNIIIPPDPVSLLGKIKGAIAAVNKGLRLVSSAIQEGTRILGEVRYFVATIDSIVDKLTTIVDSAQDFVDGVTQTLSVGRLFVSSTAALLDEALTLMEQAEGLPDAVRQNYALAADGLDAILSQHEAFGNTYDDEAAFIAGSESGAAGDDRSTLEAAAEAGPPESAAALEQARTRSSDVDLVDGQATPEGHTFGNYAGTREYAITSMDTVESLAARFLGDGSRWFDIVLINGLQPPYISETGAPGTVGVGDVIVIPTTTAQRTTAVQTGGDGAENPGQNLLGTDIALEETSFSAPGRPVVDIAIDERTLRDVKTVSGVPNLGQAIQMRIWTRRGSMPLAPRYGLPRVIGLTQSEGFLTLLKVAYRETLLQDSRIALISGTRFNVVNDLIEVDVDVVPIGAENAQTVTTAIV